MTVYVQVRYGTTTPQLDGSINFVLGRLTPMCVATVDCHGNAHYLTVAIEIFSFVIAYIKNIETCKL